MATFTASPRSTRPAFALVNTTPAGSALRSYSVREDGRLVGFVEQVAKGQGFLVTMWDDVQRASALTSRDEVGTWYFPTALAYTRALAAGRPQEGRRMQLRG